MDPRGHAMAGCGPFLILLRRADLRDAVPLRVRRSVPCGASEPYVGPRGLFSVREMIYERETWLTRTGHAPMDPL